MKPLIAKKTSTPAQPTDAAAETTPNVGGTKTLT